MRKPNLRALVLALSRIKLSEDLALPGEVFAYVSLSDPPPRYL